ncbi:unnamed protein product [Prunus armeniaca]
MVTIQRFKRIEPGNHTLGKIRSTLSELRSMKSYALMGTRRLLQADCGTHPAAHAPPHAPAASGA